MKIWGTAPLENEIGAAFALEVIQDGPAALAEAFEIVLDPDQDNLAAEEAWRALAATELLVAILNNHTQALIDAKVRVWVQQQAETSIEYAQWRSIALKAIDQIISDQSELPQLWEIPEEQEHWNKEIERLQMALKNYTIAG